MGIRLLVALRIDDQTPVSPNEEGAQHYEFDQGRVMIGRGASADVRLPDHAVAVRHAVLHAEGTRYFVSDVGSTNGTRVNGQRLVPQRMKALRDGDMIDVGRFRIRFSSGVSGQTSRERTSELARAWVRALREGRLDPSRLVIENGPGRGRVVELPPPPARLLIGRSEEAEIAIDDADASREHAEVVIDGQGVLVKDLGSKNGIEVGGVRVRERRLVDRDVFTVGKTAFVFEHPGEEQLRLSSEGEDEPLPLFDVAPPHAAPAMAEETPPSPEDVDPGHPTGESLPPPSVERVTPPKAETPFVLTPDLWVLGFALLVLAVSAFGLWWLLAA